MDAALEQEIKLQAGDEFPGIPLPGRELPARTLWSTYFDTEQLRLAGSSITLRRRVESADGDGPGAWQLKLPCGDDRLELEWDAPDVRVPRELEQLLLAHTRGAPLVAVATLRQERAGVMVERDGTDVAMVLHDTVEVREDGEVVDLFEELEVELVEGNRADLKWLESELRNVGAVDPDGRPKVLQALDVPARRAAAMPRKRSDEQLAAALRDQYYEILRHDPGTRLGDAEQLHDHRVAVRRLRALLRAGRPMLDRQWADGLRDALKPAGEALGRVRDLDVLVADVEQRSAALEDRERAGATDISDLLRDRRAGAQTMLLSELSDSRYLSLLNRLQAATDEPRIIAVESPAKMLRKEHRRARRRARRASPDTASAAELHELRKAVKHARYAAELAAASGVKGARGYVKRAKTVQDILGDHQDGVVAARVLADLDHELQRPMAHAAVDSLIEQQESRKLAARKALPKAWRRLDKRARRFC
ncbi:MAG: CHAD domain-containing protein [Gaiellales bacterium]